MTRLIDADALKKYKFTTQIANGVELEDIEVVPVASIDNAPTVELEALRNKRKKGKWIKENKPFGGFGDLVLVNTCPNPECGESFVFHGNDPKFCPECGWDMREKKEADNERKN